MTIKGKAYALVLVTPFQKWHKPLHQCKGLHYWDRGTDGGWIPHQQ